MRACFTCMVALDKIASLSAVACCVSSCRFCGGKSSSSVSFSRTVVVGGLTYSFELLVLVVGLSAALALVVYLDRLKKIWQPVQMSAEGDASRTLA
jgi:hypothetical protein